MDASPGASAELARRLRQRVGLLAPNGGFSGYDRRTTVDGKGFSVQCSAPPLAAEAASLIE